MRHPGQIRARALVVGVAALALQGCVAAVIPAIAASTIARQQMTKRPAPRRMVAAAPVAGAVTVTSLKALPPPSLAPALTAAGDPTMRLVNHALAAATSAAPPVQSMILAPGATLEKAAFMPCAAGQPLAVAIDARAATAPRLTEGLRRLQAFDIEVLWIADVTEVDGLRAVLRGNGAWRAGDAPILTTGPGAERKQAVRLEAARAFCIVGVAGTQRSEVDELYAYLRDPALAYPLDKYWDAGWFILPPAAK